MTCCVAASASSIDLLSLYVTRQRRDGRSGGNREEIGVVSVYGGLVVVMIIYTSAVPDVTSRDVLRSLLVLQ